MRWRLVGVAVLMSVQSLSAQSWTMADDPDSTVGQVKLSRVSLPCPNGGAGYEIPAFAFAADVRITKTLIWMGTDFGMPYPVVDAQATLFSSRPWGHVLSTLNLDRYAAPSAPHEKLEPQRHPLRAGDMIGGSFSCAPVIWWLGSHVSLLIIVDYEKVGR